MTIDFIQRLNWTKTFSFRDLINAGLFIYLILLVLGCFIAGTGALFDTWTFVLGFCLGGLVIYCQSINKLSSQLVQALAMPFMIFIFPRVLGYQYFPEFVEFPFGEGIGVDDINKGLFYILLGTFFLLGGMIMADRLWPVRKVELATARQAPSYQMIKVWIAVFFIELMLEAYVTMGLGISPLALDKIHQYEGNYLIMGLRTIIGVDTAILAFFTYVVFARGDVTRKQEWYWVIVVSFIYMIYLTLTGSRSGILRILMILLSVMLVFRAGRWIEVPKLISSFIVIVVLGYLSFSIGGVIKLSTVLEHRDIYKNAIFKTDDTTVASLPSKVPPKAQELKIDHNSIPASILNRLGVLDYAILVITQPADNQCLTRFMNVQYVLMNVANSLAPGEVFPEAKINTSRVFSVCYRGMSFNELLTSGYNSEFWTIWGLGFLMFGWWGGLAFLLASGVVMHVFYAIVWKWFPKNVEPYYATLYVFTFPFLVVLSMGLDHTVNTIIFLGAQTAFVLLLVNGLSALFRVNRQV